MSFNIGVSLEGADKIAELLARLERQTGNLEPVMKSIGSHVVSVALMSFRKEQTPRGAAWPKSRRADREDGQTLDDNGRLKASIDYKANGKAVRVGTIKSGTNVKYAAIHQFGFNGPVSVKAHQRIVRIAFRRELKFPVWADIGQHDRNMIMPARPYMPMTLEEIGISDIEEILIKHLTKAGG